VYIDERKKHTANTLWTPKNVLYGKAVNKIKNMLGTLQLGKVKNKYEVTILEITNIGCKSVDQHWDNEFRSGYIKGIESDVIMAKTIEDKRVKNSIFISLINMVK